MAELLLKSYRYSKQSGGFFFGLGSNDEKDQDEKKEEEENNFFGFFMKGAKNIVNEVKNKASNDETIKDITEKTNNTLNDINESIQKGNNIAVENINNIKKGIDNIQKDIKNAVKKDKDENKYKELSILELITDLSSIPEDIRESVRNNGGGHANHSFFWEILSPSGGGTPTGNLAEAINIELGGFESLKSTFSNSGMTRFGSGWAWLVLKKDGKLAVSSTPNQDNPLMKGYVDIEGTPIIGLDVWEHAYYLKYQNLRPNYIDAFWNVLDWNKAGQIYDLNKSQ